MVKKFKVGKEYTIINKEGDPFAERKCVYMGLHPYEGRHIFACEGGGNIIVPKDGEFLQRLVA